MWATSKKSSLTNKVAVITGGARGIGAACVEVFAREGANVAIIDKGPANDVKDRIRELYPRINVRAYEIDICRRQDVKRVMDDVVAQWGTIDIVVNNAGIGSRLSLEEMTDDVWERELDINLKGSFIVSQLAIYPYMKKQQYGKIVNISSVSGIIGGIESNSDTGGRSGPSYASSKGAVNALTKWIAKEVGKYGIYCNAIAPGYVETEMSKGGSYPVHHQPIARAGHPMDIAEAVLFLASPASNYVTGQVLKVCGGAAIG